MNLTHLRYFLAVAETGSVTRGAERTFVAQPTLSAAIAKLEAELGVSLLQRRGRQVELTTEGARFRDHAADILSRVAEARRSMRQAPVAASFVLGLIDTLPFPAVARLLGDFAAAHPSVSVELRQGSVAEVSRWRAQRRVDAAMTLAREAGSSRRALFRDRVAVALPRGHALARKPVLAPGDLHEAPLVVWTGLDGLPEVRRRLAAAGVQPRIVLRTPHAQDALAAVSAGLGPSIVHDSFAVENARMVPVDGIILARSLALALPTRPQPHVEAFAGFAASHAWRPTAARDRLDIAH